MRFLPAGSRRRETGARAFGVFGPLLISLLLFSAHLFAAGQVGTAGDAGRIHWKLIEFAQVRLDDKAPLKWNVFQPAKNNKKDKKESNLALVLVGHRYLLLDTQARLVYLVPVSELRAQGTDFESGDLVQESRIIPTTDWTARDVGPAELYRFTLGDYGRVLEVSLPHMPDLRPFY